MSRYNDEYPTNRSPWEPWNDPWFKNDPFAPHNHPHRRTSAWEPWNSPFGSADMMDEEDRDYYNR